MIAAKDSYPHDRLRHPIPGEVPDLLSPLPKDLTDFWEQLA